MNERINRMEQRLNRRKFLSGIVVSDKMNKTRVVQIATLSKHAMYGKSVKHRMRYKAHDEKNAAHTGDVVRIMETRPLSRDKRWVIVGIESKVQAAQ